jgi:hypothetical protein
MSEIYIYNLNDTWNNSGNVFDAIKMNVTNTASAAGSKLLNLQVGGVEKFTVGVDGIATAATPTIGDDSTKLATTAFVQDTFATFQFDASNITATWNNAGTVFTGIGLDVTDTASDASSLLMDLQVGGASKFNIGKLGTLTLSTESAFVNENYVYTGSSPGTLTHRVYTARGTQAAPVESLAGDKLIGYAAFPRLSSGFSGGPGARMQFVYRGDAAANTRATDIEFETSIGTGNIWPRLGIVNDGGIWIQVDTFDSNTANRVHLHSDVANNLALRNGTDSHSLNIYNTFTDASNYERGFIRFNSSVLEIGHEADGTGSDRDLKIIAGGRFLNIAASNGEVTLPSSSIKGTSWWNLSNAGASLSATMPIVWSDTAGNYTATKDVGLARDSAGVLKVTDGSTGQGDIIANSFIIDGADGVEHTIGTVAAGYLTFTRAGGTTNPIAFYEPEARVQLKNTGKFGWTSVSHAAASIDLALERDSAGVLKITDGSTGDGDIIVGNATAKTNLALATTAQGFTFANAATFNVISNGDILCNFDGGGSNVANFGTRGIGFAPSYGYNSVDVRIVRDSAAVLKITDGSTGYGKIIADGYQLNNPINSQTGTTYTAAVADADRYVQLNNAAAITVTVPSDTTANLPIGSTVTFEQTGAGTVTFAADTGVTINSRGAVLSTAGQFAVATIIKTASNTFTLTGDLV